MTTDFSKSSVEFKHQNFLIKSRPLLKYCYEKWYEKFQTDISSVPREIKEKEVLELGSGGSYFLEKCPDLITSDVVDGVASKMIDARNIPYEKGSLKAIVASHVFHHIPDVRKFFCEADRVLAVGGVISLIEVANTPFARLLFKNFHQEPFEENAVSWEFDSRGHMDANQALSWIVFVRDIKKFNDEFPNLKVEAISFLPWLTYICSGGVTKSPFVPHFFNFIVYFLELLLSPFRFVFSIHWHIRIRKVQ